jgi:hypothetical protein
MLLLRHRAHPAAAAQGTPCCCGTGHTLLLRHRAHPAAPSGCSANASSASAENLTRVQFVQQFGVRAMGMLVEDILSWQGACCGSEWWCCSSMNLPASADSRMTSTGRIAQHLRPFLPDWPLRLCFTCHPSLPLTTAHLACNTDMACSLC